MRVYSVLPSESGTAPGTPMPTIDDAGAHESTARGYCFEGLDLVGPTTGDHVDPRESMCHLYVHTFLCDPVASMILNLLSCLRLARVCRLWP